MHEETRSIESLLSEKETEAREFKQWLIENPAASLEERKYAQKKLLSALQAINDLVCQQAKIKRGPHQLR